MRSPVGALVALRTACLVREQAPYHLVTVYAAQRPLVDGGRVSAEAVVQAEARCILCSHAGQLLLHAFQHSDGGRVGLYHYVQLELQILT